jgi:hypothetical protein
VLGARQEVKRDVSPSQFFQPVQDGRSHYPVVFRFVVPDVTYAFEVGVLLKVVQGVTDVRVSQIYPGNDACDEVVVGSKAEQPSRLFYRGVRLHDNGALYANFIYKRFQVGRQAVPTQYVVTFWHPFIVEF